MNNHIKSWKSYLISERCYSHHTIDNYLSDLRFFLSFVAEYEGKDLTVDVMENISLQLFRAWLVYRNEHDYATASTARALGSVRSFFKYLKHQNIHNKAIEEVVTPKIGKALPCALSEKEAFSIIDKIESAANKWEEKRDKALLTLLYGSGMRIAEALSLRVRDIPESVLDTCSIMINGKGNKERIIFLLPIVQKRIIDYLKCCPHKQEANSPLFLGQKGDVLNAGVFQRSVRGARKALKLSDTATPHALRHSFATHLLNNGANIREIQELLGHDRMNTTQRYIKLTAVDVLASYANCHPRA